MNSTTISSEGCFFLLVHYRDLEQSLQNELDSLISDIQGLVNSSNDIKLATNRFLSTIFKLRIKTLNLLINENEDIGQLIEESYPYFEEMANDDRFGILGENILFAIRSNERIYKQNYSNTGKETFDLSSTEYAESIKLISRVSFDQLLSLIKSSSPPNLSGLIIEWLESSLRIEFVILAGALMKEGKISSSAQTIDALSTIIVDSAQTYNAIAIEIGLLNVGPGYHSDLSSIVSTTSQEFINEQNKIAEAGLSHFSKNWD